MRLALVASLALAFAVLVTTNCAYMNITFLNTTVLLGNNNSARVIEVLSLYVSNGSVGQYIADRQAVNLTLSDWQQVLNTNLLVEHILPTKSSVARFNFLPGPIENFGNGGIADLVLTYSVPNVTTVTNIGPRKFEYTFNKGVFNFLHTASGEALSQNTRLNILLPSGAQIVSVYPLPDSPQVSFVGNYSGTRFSWYSGEPLSRFNLQYVTQESLQSEVVDYFSNIYEMYKSYLIPLLLTLFFGLLVYYQVKNIR
jgi:hypothetical protein